MAAGTAMLVSFAACSDNPSSSDQAALKMESQLEASSVTLAKRAAAPGADVDSLKVNRVRVFVRRLKLHVDKSDTVNGDRDVKTDPFVITFGPQATTFANLSIPPGTYDKVKFEFHRPEDSQVATYLGMPDFADFVTSGRSTVIFDVTLYKAGVSADFSYKSDVNANLSLNLDQAIALSGGGSGTVILQLDPATVFEEGGSVLDPRDQSNESKIDNNIKAAIHAHKK